MNKYNDDYEKPLYDRLADKKKKLKRAGWICLLALLVISFIVYVAGFNMNEGAGSIISKVVILPLAIAPFILFIMAWTTGKSMEDVCPRCHGEYGEKVDEELLKRKTWVEGRISDDLQRIDFDTKYAESKYKVWYKCPRCGHVWSRNETVYK